MRCLCAGAACVLLLAFLAAHLSAAVPRPLPQTDVVAQLNARWQGRNFYLRGFPAVDQYKTNERGLPLKRLASESWTEAGIHVTDVLQRRSQLLIRGTRVFFVYDAAQKRWRANLTPDKEQVEIAVTPIPTDIQALQAGLFLSGDSELYASAPQEWKPFLSGASPNEIESAFGATGGFVPADKDPAIQIVPHVLHTTFPKIQRNRRQNQIAGHCDCCRVTRR